MGDRGDRRERLATKTQGGNTPEILRAPDLAGGMPLDRQPSVLRAHAFAVVLDPNEPLSSHLHGNGEVFRAGIDRVFDEFLDHRCRALDDFARGNLIGEVTWEYTDAPHPSPDLPERLRFAVERTLQRARVRGG